MSAAELLGAIENLLGGEVTAGARNLALVVLAMVAVGLLGGIFWQVREANQPWRPTQAEVQECALVKEAVLDL